MAGPFAVWMSLQALDDAEFFQDLLYFLMLIIGITYLVALVVLTRPKIKQSFLRQTTPAEKGSFGKGFSILLISFSGFLFAWWWTNLSTVLHLISVADFQGILVCLVGISIAMALGALGLRAWWSKSWHMVSGFILFVTGLVLLEHALCYSGITALVYFGGYGSAFGDTGLIIGGRFLFAVFALGGGMKMGIFDKLFGKETAALDERVKQISQALIKRARDQSWQYKVNITEEAEKIGTACGIFTEGMFKKKHHPAHFVDIAIGLLCYPPELAFSIATQFTNFASHLGWNPFGTIMVALGQIDSLYRGMFVRKSVFDEKPELFEVINNKPLRIQKVGQLLAVAILASSQNIKEAREIYHSNIFDPSVKAVLDEELKKYDEEIAREIIR